MAVIDAWLPINDRDSVNRRNLDGIPVTGERIIPLSRPPYRYYDLVTRQKYTSMPSEENFPKLTYDEKQRVAAGLQFIGRIFDNTGLNLPDYQDLSIFDIEERGRCISPRDTGDGKFRIILDRKRTVATTIHEMGHYMEWKVPGIYQKIEDFYIRLTTNNVHRRTSLTCIDRDDELDAMSPKKRYACAQEMYRPVGNNILVPHMNHRSGKYCLREYPQEERSHEILPMFLEWMRFEPYNMVMNYRDFFDEVMKALR